MEYSHTESIQSSTPGVEGRKVVYTGVYTRLCRARYVCLKLDVGWKGMELLQKYLETVQNKVLGMVG